MFEFGDWYQFQAKFWLHPIEFFSSLWKYLRARYLRGKYGWAPCDTWNMDYWFLRVIPEMLDYLAEHTHTYPGNDEFPTYEAWQEWLHKTANNLRACTEEEQEKRNPWYPLLVQANYKDKDILKKFSDESVVIAEESRNLLKEQFAELADKFHALWD